jgi:cation diffusion facilitator CzcD-associated flavoprotein CzcO
VRGELLGLVRDALGEGSEETIAANFTPKYRPWQQRVAFVPDADFFKQMKAGKVSVKTGAIERFVADGIELQSGEVLKADLVVAATGFHLSVLGDIEFTIDGVPLAFGETVTYRGMMFTGVPNLAWVFGYFRASWTLRADLVADFIVRLLNHMRAKGAEMVVPALRPEDADMPLEPWIAPDNFNPGYINRGVHLLPRCGNKTEWRHTHDYWEDNHTMPMADLDDGTLRFQ